MKILIVVTRGEIGGAQIFSLNLAKILRKLNHEITVGFGDGNFLKTELSKNNIPFINFKFLKRSLNPFKSIFFILELRDYLNQIKPDILHLNSSNALLGLLATKFTKHRPKTIFTIHGLSFLNENHKLPRPIKIIALFLFVKLSQLSDKIIFVSNTDQAGLKSKYKPKKIALIHNTCDLNINQQLSKPEARFKLEQRTAKLENAFLIGSIGRLAYPKNYIFLINIFPSILKQLPEAKLIIIGDGPDQKELQDQINERNLQTSIFLVGAIPHAYKFIKAFDLFVLPSIFEGLSLTLIEALSSGLPILSSDVGGSAEVVNHDAQQLYKLNDGDDFLRKLVNIANDQRLSMSISRKNLEYSKNFSTRKISEEYLKIYSQLLLQ